MVDLDFIEREGCFVFITHKDYIGSVNPRWFDPGAWGDAAEPVSSGGRGGAWFIETGYLSAVLRKYLRGGLVARFSKSAYLYLGEERVRSFSEFRLLSSLHARGFPVPKPIAACYRRAPFPWYRGAILVERLAGAMPLAACIADLSQEQWYALGATLRQFHEAGVFHADLNCFNILVSEGGFYLIDFDKGVIRQNASPDSPWKYANLSRLHRSLERLNWPQGVEDLANCWRALELGYQGRAG